MPTITAQKKPVIIQAIEWTGDNIDEIREFLGYKDGADNAGRVIGYTSSSEQIIISTLEGDMAANKGDYIIRGVNGEHYPCKPDIFMKSYDILVDLSKIENLKKKTDWRFDMWNDNVKVETTCPHCGGRGEGPVAWHDMADGTIKEDIRKCMRCHGTGKIVETISRRDAIEREARKQPRIKELLDFNPFGKPHPRAITDKTVKSVIIQCPECGRTQDVGVEFYNTSLCGHPLTCNGGNPDMNSHHDHEVIMQLKELKR